jgi:hypothetical protein
MVVPSAVGLGLLLLKIFFNSIKQDSLVSSTDGNTIFLDFYGLIWFQKMKFVPKWSFAVRCICSFIFVQRQPDLLVIFWHEMGYKFVAQIWPGQQTCRPSHIWFCLKDWASDVRVQNFPARLARSWPQDFFPVSLILLGLLGLDPICVFYLGRNFHFLGRKTLFQLPTLEISRRSTQLHTQAYNFKIKVTMYNFSCPGTLFHTYNGTKLHYRFDNDIMTIGLSIVYQWMSLFLSLHSYPGLESDKLMVLRHNIDFQNVTIKMSHHLFIYLP